MTDLKPYRHRLAVAFTGMLIGWVLLPRELASLGRELWRVAKDLGRVLLVLLRLALIILAPALSPFAPLILWLTERDDRLRAEGRAKALAEMFPNRRTRGPTPPEA